MPNVIQTSGVHSHANLLHATDTKKMGSIQISGLAQSTLNTPTPVVQVRCFCIFFTSFTIIVSTLAGTKPKHEVLDEYSQALSFSGAEPEFPQRHDRERNITGRCSPFGHTAESVHRTDELHHKQRSDGAAQRRLQTDSRRGRPLDAAARSDAQPRPAVSAADTEPVWYQWRHRSAAVDRSTDCPANGADYTTAECADNTATDCTGE